MADEVKDEELLECDACGGTVPEETGVEVIDRKSKETLAVYCDECWGLM